MKTPQDRYEQDAQSNSLQTAPIHYITVQEVDPISKEIYLPGWYFWDETWAYRHGPFGTRQECEDALRNYCETEL